MHDVFIAPLNISNNDLLQRVINELRKILSAKIRTTELSLDLKKSYSSERNQYYSTQIIAEAVELL